jgi:glyoxylase-like metal-dependent hydrolase (beta-lactamase superfamily II)
LVGPPPESWSVADEEAGAREVLPGLWRLRLPVAWESVGHVNAYAISRDDGILLVDCGGAGHPSCERALERSLNEAGASLSDVRLLLGTHVHSDHIGLAAWVVERTGAELWMHPDTAHFYDAMREPERIGAARERRARAEGVPDELMRDFRDVREETDGALAPIEPHRPLYEGLMVSSGLGDWEVLHTPGHAPSHVALVQRDHGVAILGDILSPRFTPYFDYGYTPDPVGEYLASLDRIDAIPEIEIGLLGHGRPTDDVRAGIAMHREGVAAQVAAVEAAVGEGAAGAFEITRRVFGPPEGGEFGVWNMTQTLGYLRHLRLAGAVVREEADDGRFRYRAALDRASSV